MTQTKVHRQTTFRWFAIIGTAMVVVLNLVFPATAASGTVFYLSPSSTSVAPGASFSTQVRLSNTANVLIDHVKAVMTFPADKLAVSSISSQSSFFAQTDSETFNNSTGTITIARESSTGSMVASQGDYLISTITFTAKAAGAATVSFNSDSSASLTNFGTNRLTGTSGGTYTITSPPPPPPSPTPTHTPTPTPRPTGTPTPTSTPKPGTTPTPTPGPGSSTKPTASPSPGASPSPSTSPNPTGTGTEGLAVPGNQNSPVISGVQVKDISGTSAKISWTTDPATTTDLKYGTSPNALTRSFTSDETTTDHLASLSQLERGKKVYFEISATNGVQQTFYQGQLVTQGASYVVMLGVAAGGVILFIILMLVIAGVIKRRRHVARTQSPSTMPKPVPSLPSMPVGPNPIIPPPADTPPRPASPPSGPAADLVNRPKPPASPPESAVVADTPPPPHKAAPPVPAPSPRPVSPPIHLPVHQPNNDGPTPHPPAPPKHPLGPSAVRPATHDEPKDMFETGEERLAQEGLLHDTPPPPDQPAA